MEESDLEPGRSSSNIRAPVQDAVKYKESTQCWDGVGASRALVLFQLIKLWPNCSLGQDFSFLSILTISKGFSEPFKTPERPAAKV